MSHGDGQWSDMSHGDGQLSDISHGDEQWSDCHKVIGSEVTCHRMIDSEVTCHMATDSEVTCHIVMDSVVTVTRWWQWSDMSHGDGQWSDMQCCNKQQWHPAWLHDEQQYGSVIWSGGACSVVLTVPLEVLVETVYSLLRHLPVSLGHTLSCLTTWKKKMNTPYEDREGRRVHGSWNLNSSGSDDLGQGACACHHNLTAILYLQYHLNL